VLRFVIYSGQIGKWIIVLFFIAALIIGPEHKDPPGTENLLVPVTIFGLALCFQLGGGWFGRRRRIVLCALASVPAAAVGWCILCQFGWKVSAPVACGLGLLAALMTAKRKAEPARLMADVPHDLCCT
jgi:hypothetical protein